MVLTKIAAGNRAPVQDIKGERENLGAVFFGEVGHRADQPGAGLAKFRSPRGRRSGP